MLETIRKEAAKAAEELLMAANLEKEEILVVGCSTSEVAGEKIGTFSNQDLGVVIFEEIYQAAPRPGVYLAAQCCEHLNRALILEKEAAKKYGLEIVNVIPQLKAGGAFATAAYARMKEAVAVEHIQAHAGIDIGDTLIGMHLRSVAVPVRISVKKLGEANLVCARTRAKYIGGERAIYKK